MAGLRGSVPRQEQIWRVLGAHGRLSVRQMSEILRTPTHTLRSTLQVMRERGLVACVGTCKRTATWLRVPDASPPQRKNDPSLRPIVPKIPRHERQPKEKAERAKATRIVDSPILSDAKKKFRQQRSGAKKRGIGWELTFDQWWDIWTQSGKWSDRGRGALRCCMARKLDRGPYAVGNVYIATNSINSMDHFHWNGMSSRTKFGGQSDARHKSAFDDARERATSIANGENIDIDQ